MHIICYSEECLGTKLSSVTHATQFGSFGLASELITVVNKTRSTLILLMWF